MSFLKGSQPSDGGGTGKSTLLRQQLPHSVRFDLLDTHLLLEFTRAPWKLPDRLQALDQSVLVNPIVIDEVQRAPKFYLFDVGVAGHVTGCRVERAAGPEFGRALERFALMELPAYRSCRGRDFPVRFRRTKSGLECDFILGHDGAVAVEVKGSASLRSGDLRAMRAYVEEHRPRNAIVISNEKTPRRTIVSVPGRHLCYDYFLMF